MLFRSHYGVSVVRGEVVGIDTGARRLALADGSSIPWDRLVVAPGLEFDLMPGMTSASQYDTLVPHAWKAGPQTELLRNQLLALKAGSRTGDVVLTIPKAPYRCPPGPYERTCVIGDWLRRNGVPAKVIVLDANPDILVDRKSTR